MPNNLRIAKQPRVPGSGASASDERLTLGQNVDQQILLAVSGGFPEHIVRTKFVQMATANLGALGVCYLAKNVQDLWLPADGQPKMGRLPNWPSFTASFSTKCDTIASSNTVNRIDLEVIEGATSLLVPVRPRQGQTELLFVVMPIAAATTDALKTLQKIGSALQLWLNGRDSADADWQVQSLSTIIELVSKLENQPNNKAAAEELANALANQWNCTGVAVGFKHGRRVRLEAISGVSKLDRGSKTSRNYLAALTESTLRKSPAVFPAVDEDNNHLLHAHRQLSACLQSESVFSFPLVTSDNKINGAVVLSGSQQQMASSELDRFANAAAPALANALRVVNRIQRTRLRRAVAFVGRQLAKLKVLAALLLLAAAIAAMFLPITYRVRCNCITEPVTRRYAVAPFDGQIVTGHVEAGDLVSTGQVLAELDGRTIRWELSGVIAEREQSIRSREIELTQRNIPKTILAELEYDRLVSEEAVLKYKRDHLQVKSPIDGVVLSGSLDRAEAASVETGQVLFEIGPITPMRIEVAIPSDEIAQVKVGFPVTVWIEGQEEEALDGTISRIHPRSETRDARNVFVAEIEVANTDQTLRPGMQGTVRIDCEERTLGWSLFHKPMNYLRSQLTWW